MPAGRPRIFKTPKGLERLLQQYFDSITITTLMLDSEQNPRLNDAGDKIYKKEYTEHPTILGMCSFLGITRQTLLKYEAKEEYVDTIKKAKEKIEKYLENQLYRHEQVTGIIFNLKNNFGWKDKQEHELTGKNGGPMVIKLEGDAQEWAK